MTEPALQVEIARLNKIIDSYRAQNELHVTATAFEAGVGMLITDAANAILQVNQEFTAKTGYQAEEVIGQNPRILSSGRHDTIFYAAMWDCLICTGTWVGEIWNKRKNGEIYAEHLTITAVKDPNGRVTRYVAAFFDITERKRMESIAEREHIRLQTILSTASDGIHIMDSDGLLVEANEAFLNMLGYDSSAIGNLRITDWDVQDSWDAIKAGFDDLIERRSHPLLIETRQRRRDGAVLNVEINTSAVWLEGKSYIYAASRDITQRKLVEEEMRIAAIAFECNEGIAVTDADFKILRVNHAFTQLTGYSAQDVRGKTIAILRSCRHSTSYYEAISSEIKGKATWQGEVWHQRKNGEDFLDRTTFTAVMGASDEVTHYVGIFTDSTGEQRQKELRLLNETAHRNILVREVHHRIKNNLQGITGILRQFAQKHPETIDPINQAIGQVQSISVIHGLLGRAITSSVRLCELTSAIADEIQRLWQTPVVMNIPADWIPCIIIENEAVPVALVLNELILNAVKHREQAQGEVSITLVKGSRADVVQINISNPGQLATDFERKGDTHSGLQLIAALMPRSSASVTWEQLDGQVLTVLELGPPVIFLDMKEQP